MTAAYTAMEPATPFEPWEKTVSQTGPYSFVAMSSRANSHGFRETYSISVSVMADGSLEASCDGCPGDYWTGKCWHRTQALHIVAGQEDIRRFKDKLAQERKNMAARAFENVHPPEEMEIPEIEDGVYPATIKGTTEQEFPSFDKPGEMVATYIVELLLATDDGEAVRMAYFLPIPYGLIHNGYLSPKSNLYSFMTALGQDVDSNRFRVDPESWTGMPCQAVVENSVPEKGAHAGKSRAKVIKILAPKKGKAQRSALAERLDPVPGTPEPIWESPQLRHKAPETAQEAPVARVEFTQTNNGNSVMRDWVALSELMAHHKLKRADVEPVIGEFHAQGFAAYREVTGRTPEQVIAIVLAEREGPFE